MTSDKYRPGDLIVPADLPSDREIVHEASDGIKATNR
jgi:hypothetical protein